MPHSRSFRGAPNARRKRGWSRVRLSTGGIVTAGVPAQLNLMSGIEALGAGVSPIGATVGPVFVSGLAVRRTSATVATSGIVTVGVRVASALIEAVDQDPSVSLHHSWMLFRGLHTPDTTLTAQFHEVDTQSSRKLEALDDTLWLVVGTQDTGTFSVDAIVSTLVILH